MSDVGDGVAAGLSGAAAADEAGQGAAHRHDALHAGGTLSIVQITRHCSMCQHSDAEVDCEILLVANATFRLYTIVCVRLEPVETIHPLSPLTKSESG